VNSRFFFAVAFLVWVASVSPLSAQGIRLTGSNLLHIDEGSEVDPVKQAEFPDNRTHRSFFENRLRLNVAYGNWTLGGRFLYFRPSEVDKRVYAVTDETGLDKRYFEAKIQPLAIRVGNFAEVFDHGLTLSLFEDRELFFDSELDGVRLSFAKGPVSVVGLKGRSRAREGFLVEEEGVTGIHAEAIPMKGWKVGASFVHMDSSGYAESNLPGLSGLATVGPVQFGGEYAWKETNLGVTQTHGHACYLELTATSGRYNLMVNYKDYKYRGWTPFQNPPIAYREIGLRLLQNREPHVFNPEDDVGYQIEVRGPAVEDLLVLVHFNHSSQHAEDQDGIPHPTLKERDWPYWEFFTGVENVWESGWSLECEAGLNEEAQTQFWYKRSWLAAEATAPIGKFGNLQFGGELLDIRDQRSDKSFMDELAFLGWDNENNLSVWFQSQWTDDEALQEREGDFWPSAEIGYSFGDSHHRAILFYGRERGGLRCSNGFCRRVQPFEGFRITLESSL
jgi:hypothetical protein